MPSNIFHGLSRSTFWTHSIIFLLLFQHWFSSSKHTIHTLGTMQSLFQQWFSVSNYTTCTLGTMHMHVAGTILKCSNSSWSYLYLAPLSLTSWEPHFVSALLNIILLCLLSSIVLEQTLLALAICVSLHTCRNFIEKIKTGPVLEERNSNCYSCWQVLFTGTSLGVTLGQVLHSQLLTTS